MEKFRWDGIFPVRNILSPFNELRRYGPMVEYRFFLDAKGSPLRRISICSNVCCSTHYYYRSDFHVSKMDTRLQFLVNVERRGMEFIFS